VRAEKPAPRALLELLRAAGPAVVLCGMLLAALAAHAADVPEASPQARFYRANALYHDGKYADAVSEYEALAATGLQSAPLYFNLGNAYFKAGQLGRAILNYERARRLDPADPDVRANLSFALATTGAQACDRASIWQRIVFPLAQRMPLWRLMGLMSGAYSLAFLGFAAFRLVRSRPRWLRSVSAALAVLAVVGATSLAAQLWQYTTARGVVAAEGETAVRFEPSATGTVHYNLQQGSVVRVLERRTGWLLVARCDGRRGWIPQGAVATL
jgi:tetratricopeptide (TPR) repeat protein